MKDRQDTDPFAEYAVGGPEALTPQEEAEQRYLAESGISDAILAGLAEGLSFGWSDEIQSAYDQFLGRAGEEGYVSPERRTELLRAGSPVAYGAADVLGSLGTALYPIPGSSSATAARLGTRLGAEAVKGAVEGAGRAKPGEIMESALTGAGFGLAGGAVGEGLSAIMRGRQGKRAITAGAEAMKNPAYKTALGRASTLETKLLGEENKLATLLGDLESEKVAVRRKAESDLKELLGESKKAAKEIESIRLKLEQSKPVSRTSPEFIEYQQAKQEVDRLQKYIDSNQKKLNELEATAPTKLGAERERGISAAKRDVVKAEERVFSAEEKSELDEALLKVMRGREEEIAAAGKAKSKNRRIAEQRAKMQAEAEAPAPASVEEPIPEFGRTKELTPRQIELLEDLVASGKSLRDIGSTVPGGMDKTTLSRRLKAYGITPESAKANAAARAEQKAALEAAAQDIVPDQPMPKFVPVPKVSRDILSRADKRKLLQAEELNPIRQEAELGRLTRAQERLGAAEAAPLPSLAESRFAPEVGIRNVQLSQAQSELSQARQTFEQALENLRQAQAPRGELQQSLARAEQAAGEAAQTYDDALKAFEQQSYMRDLLIPPKVSAQQQNIERTRQELQKVQELARQIFNKDVDALTAQEAGLITKVLEGSAPGLAGAGVRTTGARQQ